MRAADRIGVSKRMKLKNINIIEQHVEKIVLALATLFSLYVLGFYVLGKPYAVELRGRKLSPAQAEVEKQNKLKTLESSLQSSDSGLARELAARKVDGYAEEYKKRLERPLLARDRLAIPFNRGGLSPTDVTVPEQGVVEYLVEVPMPPIGVTVRTSSAVLLSHDEIITRLIQRLGAQEAETAKVISAVYDGFVDEDVPRDFEPVTIMAEFDMDLWVQQLEAAPQPQRIPRTWWQRRLLVADVVLERQALDPETGQWPEDDVFEVIAPLPGSVKAKLRPMMDEQQKWDLELGANVIVDYIDRNAEEIERPPLEMITQDRVWLPPDAEVKDLDAEQERELFELRKRIRTLLDRLEKLRGPKFGNKMSDSRSRDLPDGTVGFMEPDIARSTRSARQRKTSGPTRSARQPKTSRPTRSEDRQEAIRRVELELQEKQAMKDDLLGTTGRSRRMFGGRGRGPESYSPLTGPKFGVPGMRMPDMRTGFPGLRPDMPGTGLQARRQPRPLGGAPLRPGLVQSVEAEPQIFEIWAHDLSAKPGRSYRYRLRVRVFNPLFQKGNRLGEKQRQKYGNLLALESEPSEWSDRVKIETKMRFFVVSASGNRADIEMYRMFGGRRHLEKFRAGPGDSIGVEVILNYQEEARTVNMSTPNVVIDVQSRKTAEGVTTNTVLIYYDQLTGQLKERVVELDRVDEDRIRFSNEHAQIQALARRPGG